MQTPLQLNKEEKLQLMRALYSIFYRDDNLNDAEHPVLRLLNQCFNISLGEYKHYVHVNVAEIAKEINAIRDERWPPSLGQQIKNHKCTSVTININLSYLL